MRMSKVRDNYAEYKWPRGHAVRLPVSSKESDIKFGMSVVVPQGGWELSLETPSVISPSLNEKNVERSCHVLFQANMFQYFPGETKKNHKKFKIFRLWAGIQTHHIKHEA